LQDFATPPEFPEAIGLGLIWPPVEGREYLEEIHRHEITVSRRGPDEWSAEAGPWRLYLAAGCRYPTLERGREELVTWAHWHAQVRSSFSPQRCLLLGALPDGSVALWQAVRREASLAENLSDVLALDDPKVVADALFRAADTLEQLHSTVAPTGLRVDLNNSGVVATRPAYLSLAPTPRGIWMRPRNFVARPLAVEEAFAPLLSGPVPRWRRRGQDLAAALVASPDAQRKPEVSARLQEVVALL
jgi:hypothetical protein